MTKVLKESYFDTIHYRKDSNLKVVAKRKKKKNKFKGIKSLYYGENQMFITGRTKFILAAFRTMDGENSYRSRK